MPRYQCYCPPASGRTAKRADDDGDTWDDRSGGSDDDGASVGSNSFDDDIEVCQDPVLDIPIQPTRTARLTVGSSVLHITTSGRIKCREDDLGSDGIAMLGTPYHTFVVEGNEYYVHDLVWRAFNGDPPEGWEVRHKIDAARADHYYDNDLESLEIYPARVIHRPRLVPSPPRAVRGLR